MEFIKIYFPLVALSLSDKPKFSAAIEVKFSPSASSTYVGYSIINIQELGVGGDNYKIVPFIKHLLKGQSKCLYSFFLHFC